MSETLGSQVKIGILLLSTDQVTEGDARKVLPGQASLFVSRMRSHEPLSVENLARLEHAIGDAAELLSPELDMDVIAFSCTSGAALLGPAKVRAEIQKIHPDTPCVTPFSAAMEAFQLLGVKRPALVTPYPADVNRMLSDRLREGGVEPSALRRLELNTDAAMAGVAPDEILAILREADHPDADGLFLSCTGWRACEVADKAEAELQKPVVTANQALFWRSLRISGYNEPVEGFGRLLHL